MKIRTFSQWEKGSDFLCSSEMKIPALP